MPNGQELLSDMELEVEMDAAIVRGGIKELVKFGVRQSYETRKDITILQKDIECTRKRSIRNQIAILVIIVFLVGGGILDANIFHVVF